VYILNSGELTDKHQKFKWSQFAIFAAKLTRWTTRLFQLTESCKQTY